MPYHATIHFRDQRYRKSVSGTERLDDELLRVVADLQSLERCDSHLGYRANIVMCLVPDNDPWIHGLIFVMPGLIIKRGLSPIAPDCIGSSRLRWDRVSIHAPARGATSSGGNTTNINVFQATRPRGARLFPSHDADVFPRVSIHAPARGATTKNDRSPHGGHVSIHAPARGATICPGKDRRCEQVSIHAPARGATIVAESLRYILLVSIHAPARGATMGFYPSCIYDGVSIHAPARGATRSSARYSWAITSFNPRARAGRDHVTEPMPSCTNCFNPRARAGRDACCRVVADNTQVSIHAPARGATADWRKGQGRVQVSIHAPARGATGGRKRGLRS